LKIFLSCTPGCPCVLDVPRTWRWAVEILGSFCGSPGGPQPACCSRRLGSRDVRLGVARR
jgi:hypothetical protein